MATRLVTPVPNRRMILLLNKLEMMVPHDMTDRTCHDGYAKFSICRWPCCAKGSLAAPGL